MRVQWWWGLVTFVPLLVVFFVLVGATDGFQSPADVEGDRTISVANAEQVRKDADAAYAGSIWQADRRYAEEMPTAQKWSERRFGLPLGGLVTLGLVGVGIACTVLAALIGALQGAVRRHGARRDQDRRRAHELAMEREKTARKQMELVMRTKLPEPSKPAEDAG